MEKEEDEEDQTYMHELSIPSTQDDPLLESIPNGGMVC